MEDTDHSTRRILLLNRSMGKSLLQSETTGINCVVAPLNNSNAIACKRSYNCWDKKHVTGKTREVQQRFC